MPRLLPIALPLALTAFSLAASTARADGEEAEIARAHAWLSRLEMEASSSATTRAPARGDERVLQVLPADFQLQAIERDDKGRLLIRLDGDFGPAPDLAADPGASEDLDELRLELLNGALLAADVYAPVQFLVRTPSGDFRPLDRALTPEEAARREQEHAQARLDRARRQASRENERSTRAARLPKGGALLGKRIALSPGHGWTGSGWQRSLGCAFSSSARGILEDWFNAQMVANWLIPMFENMGAEIILVREPDMSSGGQAIVEQGSAGYSETGTWGDGANEGGWNGNYRTMSGQGGTASLLHTFPTSGWRRISAWHLHGTNRTANAIFRVRHAGGQTSLDVDQTKYGKQFLDLGNYWCAAGEPCGVDLENGSTGYLISDAIKLGSTNHPSYGKPWWQMQALNYVKEFLGVSSHVSGNNVTTPPTHANAAAADLYISVHGNAAGSNCTEGATAHGISTYRYNCSGTSVQDSAANCDSAAGSKAFAETVHSALIARVRADWDANYCDRRVNLKNLGEVRVGKMPSLLLELGFFDNLKTPQSCSGTAGAPRMTDNQAMHDPRWREAVAYGIAEGVAKYLGTGGAPPIRPTGLRAINGSSPCALTVSWNAVSGATAYRLYRIDNVRPGYERAFDAGTIVEGTSATLSDLTPGKVYVFRVAALNASGEGFPSAAVAARVLSAGSRVEGLYVNGYDRRDAWVQEQDNDLAYAAEHGIALGAVADDFYFDGVLKEVVEDGDLDLADYAVIDYQAGKNSTEHHSVSSAMQAKLTNYLSAGGKLFISGEELGWDLGNKQNGKDFLEGQLKASYVADDAGVLAMSGSGPFAGLSGITLDDGTRGTYEVIYPDALAPTSGGTAVMRYDGTSYTAAVESQSAIVFGVPLETVYPASSRAKIFACGIGRLLNGSSWTCTPSSIAAPAAGAAEGSCTEPAPPNPPDAGVGGEDAGELPLPEGDAGSPDPTFPDAGSAVPDSGETFEPIDPNQPLPEGDAGTHDSQSFVGIVESSGCAQSPGPAAGLPGLLPLALIAGTRARRRRAPNP